jgi:hypothetical protein
MQWRKGPDKKTFSPFSINKDTVAEEEIIYSELNSVVVGAYIV